MAPKVFRKWVCGIGHLVVADHSHLNTYTSRFSCTPDKDI